MTWPLSRLKLICSLALVGALPSVASAIAASGPGDLPLPELDPTWVELPANTPLYSQVAIPDLARNRIVYWGGLVDYVRAPRVGRVLTLDQEPTWTSWTPGGPAPEPRLGEALQGAAAVLDPMEELALGICDCSNGTGHVLDLKTDTWSRAPSDRPLPYWHAVAGYDGRHDRGLLFGGDFRFQGDLSRDGWAYDLSTERSGWEPVEPLPSARAFMTGGQVVNDRMYVFGGQDGRGNEQSQTWRLEITETGATTWEDVTEVVGEAPPSRVNGSLTLDPETGYGFLFGGYHVGSDRGDLWLLDASDAEAPRWERLDVPGGPSARSAHAAVWDPREQRVILHGGIQGEGSGIRFLGDTWALYPYGRSGVPTPSTTEAAPTVTAEATSTQATPDSVTATSTASAETSAPDRHLLYLPALRNDTNLTNQPN